VKTHCATRLLRTINSAALEADQRAAAPAPAPWRPGDQDMAMRDVLALVLSADEGASAMAARQIGQLNGARASF
jgi:hypothetical protein